MIAVDTSALLAIILEEEDAEACIARFETAERAVISAGTVAEALIVATRRKIRRGMERLIEDLGLEVVPVTLLSAQRTADAYDAWGKGAHPAALNFGDCFAYETARSHGCPLLYVGGDFARTDIESAI